MTRMNLPQFPAVQVWQSTLALQGASQVFTATAVQELPVGTHPVEVPMKHHEHPGTTMH